MNIHQAALTIHLSPLVSGGVLVAIFVAVFLLMALSAVLYRRGLFWRGICATAFITVLLNPSVVEREREAVRDVAVILADRSLSQDNGSRTERTDEALEYLKAKLENRADLELRIVEAPQGTETPGETRLFSALDQALVDVPADRRAGVIILSDGQIHDIPGNPARFNDYGPVHVFLTGDKDEKDRQLVIVEAPAYGIVGQSVTIRYRIEDTANTGKDYATLLIRNNDADIGLVSVPVNEEQTLDVTISHAGQNIIDLEAAALEGEITLANNRAPLVINGVRDRLRVLLVSGQPHAGGRMWRNILTSDPGVDLVHFTILREPDKLDTTPQRELSLIAFPFRELFEVKLYDFDLIIFDRYRLKHILPEHYFANIARYVQEGGALLEASGPSFAGEDSVYRTALQDILPAFPTGQVIEKSFIPTLTQTGKRHPVTQNLTWHGGTPDNPGWGSWLRQVRVSAKHGHVLMSGADKKPLLILARAGEGRVAQLASDQIWLWARGFEGGGPQAELLRRMAHWLMKEPELDENALDITIDDNKLTIRRRSLQGMDMSVTVIAPGGDREEITLKESSGGWLEGHLDANELGVYVVEDGDNTRFVIAGDFNPPELRGIISTPDLLYPLTEASKGGIYWLSDNKMPDIRFLPPKRDYAGESWIALRKNNAFHITGIKDKPFLPDWVYALILLALILSTWWFEGRQKGK